jgi:hypothetical protein
MQLHRIAEQQPVVSDLLRSRVQYRASVRLAMGNLLKASTGTKKGSAG